MDKACLLLNHISLKVIYITTAHSMRTSQMVLPRSKRDLGNVVLGLQPLPSISSSLGERITDLWQTSGCFCCSHPYPLLLFFFFFSALCATDFFKKFPFFPLLFVIYMVHYSYFNGFPYSFNIYT